MRTSLDAPVRFEPQILPKPWGGGSQLRAFGVPVPQSPPTGEVWLISDVPGRSSRIVSGLGSGGLLEDLVRSEPKTVLGAAGRPGDRFPILVKLLEVRGALSLQVHPDDSAAQRNGDGPRGKFEAWSVLGTLPGARTILGVDRELAPHEVRALIASRCLEDGLNAFDARPGDAYVITPGTVHAARGGLLLLEVQETADVTYRLYDWGTVGLDGRPRELHVEKALSVANLKPCSPKRPPAPAAVEVADGVRRRTIVPAGRGPFIYDLVELDQGARLEIGGDGRPWAVATVDGTLALASDELRPGDSGLWLAAAPRTAVVARTRCSFALAAPSVTA